MYQNPVLNVEVDQGDPAILRFKGKYYLYHTGGTGVPVYTSSDLVNWEHQGIALHASDKDGHWAGIDLWAPEIIYAQGKFYMYVTGARKANGRGDDRFRRIGVAIAENPLGPFELADEPLTDEWSIDAHPFLDSDGKWYMFYNVRNKYTTGPNGVIGCGNVVDAMVNFEKLAGEPSFVCKPEFSWEGNHGQTWFWNEGPFTIKRLGKYYQMYSGGCFHQSTYHVAFATASTCHSSEGMGARNWVKWPKGESKPILASTEDVWGPGHHVVTKGPNGVDNYIVYHGHIGDDPSRTDFIDPLYWHGDVLYVEGPTSEKRPAPFLPKVFRESWSIAGQKFLEPSFVDYLWEGWLTLANPVELYLAYQDGDNQIVFRFDGLNCSVVSTVEGKSTTDKLELKPAASFAQQFRVIKNGQVVEFHLNDLLVWRGNWLSTPAQVGVGATEPIIVEGVTLTQFFTDSFTKQFIGKESSGLVTHTLQDSLDAWQILTGDYKVLDAGIVGMEHMNKIKRQFIADRFRFSLDVAGEGIVEVTLNGTDKVILDLQNKQLLTVTSSYQLELYPDQNWCNLQVEHMGSTLEIKVNGESITEITPSIAENTFVEIQSDELVTLNNIAMVALK